MAKLWKKDGDKALDRTVEAFCFGRDVVLDGPLVSYDILGSLAHARMLRSIGVLSAAEHQRIARGLVRIERSYRRGGWKIAVEDEDVHTAVEARLGKAGEKLHTARSRNDQVLTDTRLFCLDHICRVAASVASLAEALADKARRHEFLPMPGYTHLQQAMPSSCGMWLASFSEELLDILVELDAAYQLMDRCPLGSGAGYGVPLPVDRRLTARLLGFSSVQNNSLYCQNSRGHFEASAAGALCSVMAVLSRLGSDVCLFASKEFGFLRLGEGLVTGSSIMPNKRNPDLFELIRARASVVNGLAGIMRSIPHGLPSGYSKDLQEMKGPLLDVFALTEEALSVCIIALRHMEPDAARMRSAMSREIFAADHALDLAAKGVPFRKAYHEVKARLDSLPATDPGKSIRSRRHSGATGNLGLPALSRRIRAKSVHWKGRTMRLKKAWNSLYRA